MSQEDILNIIKELGGAATPAEIRERAKTKFPRSTLYTYTADRLRKLKNWGAIEFIDGKWRLKK